MELSAVIQRKDTLETEITKLIMEFQSATSLKVTDIKLFSPIPYTGGFTNVPVVSVTVKVEI